MGGWGVGGVGGGNSKRGRLFTVRTDLRDMVMWVRRAIGGYSFIPQ